MRKMIIRSILVVVLAFSQAPAWAYELASKHFEPVTVEAGKTLQLRGEALKRAFFFKVFRAAFYTEEGAAMQDPLADVAKRIEVHYFVDIPADKLSEFTVESMLENITLKDFQGMAREIEMMRTYFVDLKPGDIYSLTYVPGVGTKFIYNDTLVGIIEGAEFAKAVFSTWIGRKPFDPQLKDRILGLSAPADIAGLKG